MTKNPLAFVIEDDKNLALAFAEAVEEADFDVEILYDGKTAMERLPATIPDVVLLDLHLPYVSGEEIIADIRTDARLARTRVIVTTADPRMAELLRT